VLGFKAVNGTFAGCAMNPHVGYRVPPVFCLSLDIVQILERSERPKAVTNVVNGSLCDFSLLVWLSRITSQGSDVEVSQKGQEGFVVSDKRAIALDYRREHIVVNQFSACTMKEAESIEETAMQGFLL